MKIKVDENLPTALVSFLAGLGHDTDTVFDEHLNGRDDPDVWTGAQNAGRMLFTQDLHFSDVRDFTPGTHHGLVLVRIAAPGRRALAARLEQILASEPLDDWARCFVVVSDAKIRVRRPGEGLGSSM
jgi:predicted nuclease of predicted toxin-antitoxin system